MSLRSKVLAIVAVVVTVYGIVGYVVQNRIIFPSFVRLEREDATADLKRCVSAIEREVQQLGTSAGDYGAWNDTAQFVLDGNQKYIDDNLSVSSVKGLGLNLLYICNLQGKVVGSRTLDLSTQESIDVPGFPKERFSATHTLLQLKDPKDAVEGITITGMGPMLVASRPVLNNEREGPVRGAVIMGKLLNADLIAKLRAQTQVEFEVLAGAAGSPPVPAGGNAHDTAVSIDDSSPNFLHVATTLLDLDRKPVLPITAVVPRAITARGSTALRFANCSIIAVGLLVLVALLASLQWAVAGANVPADEPCRAGGQDRRSDGEAERGNRRRGRYAGQGSSTTWSNGLRTLRSGSLPNPTNRVSPRWPRAPCTMFAMP